MKHGTYGEVELKFELDSRSAKKARRHLLLSKTNHDTKLQRSIYFDTDNSDAHQAGYSLRVRDDGNSFTQTVKTTGGSAGLFDRREWETRVEQMAPDPDALRRTPLGKMEKLVREAKPVVCSEVKRTTWLIDRDGSIVEVVLDSGSISADGNEAPLHELELELRTGKQASLFAIAQELGRVVPLHVGVLSKEERGRMLARGAFGHENKAKAIDLRKKMDAGQVFALIVYECVRHFRLNEALIIEERDPDALHQARVAIRRLRTALSLFQPAIQQGSLVPLREELRGFIAPFGDARNLDVFLDTHGPELRASERRKLTTARDEAYDQVVETLMAQRSRDMLLDLIEWTVSANWRKDAASAPIGKFAARRLNAAWRNVMGKGKGLGDLGPKRLHQLRISLKRMRYAVDFFAPLFAKKQVRKFGSSLEKMQDCLGLIHDDMVSRQIVADFGLGERDRTEITSRSQQLKAVATRFKHLKRQTLFWRS